MSQVTPSTPAARAARRPDRNDTPHVWRSLVIPKGLSPSAQRCRDAGRATLGSHSSWPSTLKALCPGRAPAWQDLAVTVTRPGHSVAERSGDTAFVRSKRLPGMKFFARTMATWCFASPAPPPTIASVLVFQVPPRTWSRSAFTKSCIGWVGTAKGSSDGHELPGV
jgi:hypothetical protein